MFALLTVNNDLIQWEIPLDILIVTLARDDMGQVAHQRSRRSECLGHDISCSPVRHRWMSQYDIGRRGVCEYDRRCY